MTYENIRDWVEENFDLSKYGTAKELWLDVGKRFVEDGMYLPPEAESYINESWESIQLPTSDTSPIMGRSLDDYVSPLPRDVGPVEIVRPEVFEPVGFDLGETVVQPMPDILQPAPERPSASLRDIGRVFKNAFKRLFGR